MAQRLNPAARDAAVSRTGIMTAGVVLLGLAGTVGLGVSVAAATPVKTKKAPVTAGYDQTVPAPQGKVAVPPKQAPQNQAPQNQVPEQPKTGGTAPRATTPKATAPKATTPKPAPRPQPTQQAPDTSSGGS
ncbi:MAG: hypothetical protein ABW215_01090 [Kibdelosporangium sp.]